LELGLHPLALDAPWGVAENKTLFSTGENSGADEVLDAARANPSSVRSVVVFLAS
jgi:hypothetical protein